LARSCKRSTFSNSRANANIDLNERARAGTRVLLSSS
jgi:hypothetical protein